MTVLLPNRSVMLFRGPTETDSHGWVVEDTPPNLVGTFQVAWQGEGGGGMGRPRDDARASEQGGRGPLAPDVSSTAKVFFDLEAAPEAGDRIATDGKQWIVQAVQTVHDPTDGGFDCVVAWATEWDSVFTEDEDDDG